MAAVTICSGFGAQEKETHHFFHFPPSICHEVNGLDAMISVFLMLSFKESDSCSVMSDSLRTHGVYSAWNSPGQNTGVGSVSLLQGIRSPTLQVDSLPAEPQGKPKNTGMDNLSLLQQIFQTQESNQGLLHCRQILYQLSYQGSPRR